MDNTKGDQNYWSNRWKTDQTKWDIGYASTPLAAYIDTLTDKSIRILVPGCGNAYEAEYLHKKGFQNVYVLDFVAEALDNFAERVPGFPKAHLLNKDFFELDGMQFDLILEQTFFCAIVPSLRKNYVQKMLQLLAPGGKLVGLLFNDPELNFDNPPYGGNEAEYRQLFSPYFSLEKLEPAHNSIAPRAGRELFFEFRKK